MHVSKQGQACHSIHPRHGCLLRSPPHLHDEPDHKETGTRKAQTGHPEQRSTPLVPRIISPRFGGAPVFAVPSRATAGARLSPWAAERRGQPRSSCSRSASPARRYEPLWIVMGWRKGPKPPRRHTQQAANLRMRLPRSVAILKPAGTIPALT